MRSVLSFAALALAAAIFVPRYAATSNSAPPAAAPAAMAVRAAPPVEPAPTNSRSVVVRRSGRGHFEVEGRVNGRRMKFMVDTGASVVALTADDAATLGLHPAEREFSALIKTANGTVKAAPVELNTVEIGDLMVHAVDAIVLPNSALSDNLLGLSFLSRLQRFAYANGTLVLEQ
jgi:aspartyl protease family protein